MMHSIALPNALREKSVLVVLGKDCANLMQNRCDLSSFKISVCDKHDHNSDPYKPLGITTDA